jgi:ABC-type multidrug transport system fused ATPase/permease subunit
MKLLALTLLHERTATVTVRTDQELRQSFVDMGYIRNVLMSVNPTVLTDPLAPSIEVLAPRNGPSDLEFRNVTFHYGNDTSKGELLNGVNLKISSGQNVAIVGPSGSGKSTTLRLISRMLDPNSGQVHAPPSSSSYICMAAVSFSVLFLFLFLILLFFSLLSFLLFYSLNLLLSFFIQSCTLPIHTIRPVVPVSPPTTTHTSHTQYTHIHTQIFLDGVDTRTVSLESLRGRISVVPQDTSLFDETVEYNLRYEKEKEEGI